MGWTRRPRSRKNNAHLQPRAGCLQSRDSRKCSSASTSSAAHWSSPTPQYQQPTRISPTSSRSCWLGKKKPAAANSSGLNTPGHCRLANVASRFASVSRSWCWAPRNGGQTGASPCSLGTSVLHLCDIFGIMSRKLPQNIRKLWKHTWTHDVPKRHDRNKKRNTLLVEKLSTTFTQT